ncbi:hypothetical protein NQ318_002400 [Aromia moschata]|uniref:La-related protein 7 n=1 Tax=Aromia moschata TaxID=1265417 RepID=A0AAV8YF99_9CUCU|nr:hypothetical protein NQ318_002400 [Aromia moschata]
MGEGECEVVEAKKGRHRKKQLYNSILQQMEFYFSDSNLSKDRYLSKVISENPYVDIKIKENVDECTIYVENIKTDANHEWLKHVFSDFGNVVYVSIPKYKQTRSNKGFAFIEFETENEAQNALDYFENIGCKMPSDASPDQLRSITTFEDDTSKNYKDIKGTIAVSSECGNNESNIPKKRKLSDEGNEQEKKIKTEADEDLKDYTKKENVDLDYIHSKNENIKQENINKIEVIPNIEPKDENKTENLETNDAENKKKKKHKKDRKKNYIKELGLQILSKKEWKKMRNRYLDLQKKKMKEFKYYLQKKKFNQKYNMPKKERDDTSTPTEEQLIVKEEVPDKLEYVPGVIVKLSLPEPCLDLKKLKNDIKATSSDVKYVDIPISAGGEQVYVRFSNCESAKEFCRQEFVGERTVLENEDEKSYWDKIQNDRTTKFTKSVKKQRGRDKLLRKAEKERAKHIRFEEETSLTKSKADQ